MQQGDYTSYYQQQYPHLLNPNPNTNPNANLIDPPQNQTAPFASAPPFSTGYDYSPYPPNYPPYPPPHNPDPPRSPTASTYIPTATTPSLQPPFNPPPTSQPSFSPYDHHGPPYQQPQQTITPANPQPFFPPLDQHQTSAPPSYAGPTASIPPGPTPTNPPYSSIYTASYNQIVSSVPVPGSYDNLHDNSLKFDQGAGYFEDKYGGGYNWSRSGSGSGSDPYGKRPESVRNDDVYGDGVYAYEGGKTEPYGARGTAPKSSTWSVFDDFGRPISFPSSGKDTSMGSGLGKIVRAVPKVDAQQDVKDGVQKFRVKLLTESAGQSTMDVLCQIGLDGIRMLDPNTSRTLRIYPLENITRCDKFDSSTFAFWSKSSVDNEPRRIRLQSNSYTTNTLLDTVTAATVQFKEMGGRSRPSNITKTAEPSTEKKKGFVDWMNLIKPGNEEKDHWVPDEAISKCTGCGTDFSAFVRKHHCRNCGDIFCDKCTHGRIALTAEENAQPVRVCDRCLAEVTQRLSNAKEAASKPVGLQSHEDLARKLQEEMEKNRKSSLGTKSDGSGRRMKEVACPTCTVHLQVQVPTSGSETIECGVCQHPFLVSAH